MINGKKTAKAPRNAIKKLPRKGMHFNLKEYAKRSKIIRTKIAKHKIECSIKADTMALITESTVVNRKAVNK